MVLIDLPCQNTGNWRRTGLENFPRKQGKYEANERKSTKKVEQHQPINHFSRNMQVASLQPKSKPSQSTLKSIKSEEYPAKSFESSQFTSKSSKFVSKRLKHYESKTHKIRNCLVEGRDKRKKGRNGSKAEQSKKTCKNRDRYSR